MGLLGYTDNEPSWEASNQQAGTAFLHQKAVLESIQRLRKQVDFLILSLHLGPNMRKRPTSEYRDLAHQFIDLGVDIIHGHSSHVFQGVEIYQNKVIFYDTGDLVDDYAIDPTLHNDRSFFFIVEINPKGIQKIRLIPTIISNFQVNIAKDPIKKAMFDEMQTLSKEFHTGPWTQNEELFIHL